MTGGLSWGFLRGRPLPRGVVEEKHTFSNFALMLDSTLVIADADG